VLSREWGGKVWVRSLAFSGVIAHYPQARELPAHIVLESSPGLEISNLAATRLLISKLAIARVLCYPDSHPQLPDCTLIVI